MNKDMQEVPPAEDRVRQTYKYIRVAIIAVLLGAVITGLAMQKSKANEIQAIKNSVEQAQTTSESDICKTFPDEPLCVEAQKIVDDPTTETISESEKTGKNGRGVTSFVTNANKDLIVSYTDGTTANLGRIVGRDGIDGKDGEPGKDGEAGKDGIDGQDGEPGRGITGTSVQAGALVVSYTDGVTEVIGNIVGPAGSNGINGKDGENGKDGQDGQPGSQGPEGPQGPAGPVTTIEAIVVDESTGNVTVKYTGDAAYYPVGQVNSVTIQDLICENNVLTITLSNGSTRSASVVCELPPEAPAPAPVAPGTVPAPETPVAPVTPGTIE